MKGWVESPIDMMIEWCHCPLHGEYDLSYSDLINLWCVQFELLIFLSAWTALYISICDVLILVEREWWWLKHAWQMNNPFTDLQCSRWCLLREEDRSSIYCLNPSTRYSVEVVQLHFINTCLNEFIYWEVVDVHYALLLDSEMWTC